MNALFLKYLGIKTHRGIEGRVRGGHSGGGLSFGYRVPRRLLHMLGEMFEARPVEVDDSERATA